MSITLPTGLKSTPTPVLTPNTKRIRSAVPKKPLLGETKSRKSPRKLSHIPVAGLNIYTGERKDYPNAWAAYKDGNGYVSARSNKAAPLKRQWLWRQLNESYTFENMAIEAAQYRTQYERNNCIRKSFYISEQLFNRLMAMSKKTGTQKSALLNDLLRKVL